MKRRLWAVVMSVLMLGIVVPTHAAAKVPQKVTSPATCANICISVASNADQQQLKDKAVSHANVNKLRKFLDDKGYSADFSNVHPVVITVNDVKAHQQSIATQYFTVLLPFTAPNATQGFIGFWGDGQHWDAVATDAEAQHYVVKANKIEHVSRAEVAAQLPMPLDGIALPANVLPTKFSEGSSVTDQPSSTIKSASISILATSGCQQVNEYHTEYTVLGFVFYRWHQVKHWCWSGTSLTSWQVVSTYYSEISSQADAQGLFQSRDSNCSTTTQQCQATFRQGKVANVIPVWGTISYSYPWVEIRVYPDGWWSRSNGSR